MEEKNERRKIGRKEKGKCSASYLTKKKFQIAVNGKFEED